MQNQSINSLEHQASDAVLIESLLDQAQNSLLTSGEEAQISDKRLKLTSAKKMAEEVLSLDQANSDAHHILALSHTLLGESSRAKKHIAKAFEFGEQSLTLKLEKAHIDLAAGHYNKAEAGFADILKEQPNNVDAFLGIAISKQRKKDWGSAFLHYNSLINKDIKNDTIIGGLQTVLPHIEVDFWTAEYERTILSALTCASGEKSGLAKISNSLVIHKYNLEQRDTQLDFAELVADPLLLAIIQHKLIATPEIEGLVTILRETIVTQITAARELPDILEEWVLALAEAAVYYGYCWSVNDAENNILCDLSHAVKAQAKTCDIVENCAGAVMLYSMYEELYAAPFSFLLMAITLTDWPEKMRSFLASSLYEPARLHSIEVELKQAISPSHSSLIYEREPLAPHPKWHQLHVGEEQSATQFLLATFGDKLPLKSRKRPLNVLVSTAGTGQHCLQMASQFNDVNLTGADSSIANLAYAEYQSRNYDIDNVRWVQCTETKLTCLNQRFDLVDWTKPLNFSVNPLETLRFIKRLMATTGIAKLRIELNQQRPTENLLKKLASGNQLPADLDTIRNVRHALIEDTEKDDWHALLSDPGFYHTGVCLDMLFGSEHHAMDAEFTDALLKESQLRLLGISDADGIDTGVSSLSCWESASPLTQKNPKNVTVFVKVG